MKLVNEEDRGIDGRGKYGLVFYDIEGYEGPRSILELISLLKEKVPVIGNISVEPVSDHSCREEAHNYSSYGELEANQHDFLYQDIEFITLFGLDGSGKTIMVGINLGKRTVGISRSL